MELKGIKEVDSLDGGHGCRSRIYPLRLAVALTVFFVLAFGLCWLKWYGVGGSPTVCVFNHWTGFYCPGCGMTRATSAVLDFEFAKAFRYNPLGVILFPIAMIGVGLETIGWVRGVGPPWKIPLGRYGAPIIAALVILFFILRNLPWYPFSLLAPHG